MNTNTAIAKLPEHIAIIMDGNNRYGKIRQLAVGGGHIAGKDALDPVVEHCRELGVKVLTVFAFSSENWHRPADEVALLMQLLAQTITEQLPRMQRFNIRLRFIGERHQLSDALQQQMCDAEAQTAHFTAMTLVIAVSYGGQWDMVNAAKQLAQQVQTGRLEPEQINQAVFHQYTALSDVPPVDLLIRTGGEYRISNFMLWQTAYAELYFTDCLWPNFTPAELDAAIVDFNQRERRFGQTSEQVQTVQKSLTATPYVTSHVNHTSTSNSNLVD